MNRFTLTLGLAAMDVCWISPWALLLGLWTDAASARPLLSPPSILALILAGALSTQALGRPALGSRPLRVALVCIGGLAALLAVRLDQFPSSGVVEWLGPFVVALAAVIGQFSAAALAFGLGLYLWWRGVRLGSQHASYVDAESAFRWGIARLVALGLVIALTTRPNALPSLEAQTTPFVVGFFFVSLLTLALGRLESLRTRTRQLGVNSQWFGALVVVAGLVVLTALLLGQLVSFDVLIVVSRPLFELLGRVLVLLLYAVVIPLSYVIEWLIYLVLSLLGPAAGQPPPLPPQPSDVDDWLQRMLSQYLSPELLVVLKVAGAAALLAAALLIIARATSRWRASSADADLAIEERDSVFDAQRAWSLLLSWLRRRFGRRLALANEAARHAPGGPVEGRYADLSSVRELYRYLLRLGAAAGAPRALATTPLEHLPSLAGTLEPVESLQGLTEAYVRARYAESEPSPAEMVALQHETMLIHVKSADG
jgi:hypothetical protein